MKTIETRLSEQYDVLHHPDGVISVQLRARKTEKVENGKIPLDYRTQSIGVKCLTEVESHVVNTVLGTRSHVMHFINGGVLRFAYQLGGALLSLEAENLMCELSERDEILFYCPVV